MLYPIVIVFLSIIMSLPIRTQELKCDQISDRLRLFVAKENLHPTLRIILPGYPESDQSIEIIFPEHVTAVQHNSKDVEHLYMHRNASQDEHTTWRHIRGSFEYERNLQDAVHMRARATLEEDGVLFHYELDNLSDKMYDMIYAVTCPRLTNLFHDLRMQRTYVHYKDGFELLASEVPARSSLPLDQWLPCRCLASFNWSVPKQRIESRDGGITFYNSSRSVDIPLLATISCNNKWVIASFARETGNVWSNPELTCQHVDPQISLPPGYRAVLEIKILIIQGSLNDVLRKVEQQRNTLKHETISLPPSLEE